MHFSNWLLSQSDRDDPVGDLANDAILDPPPGGQWGVDDLRRHMMNRRACTDAFDALREARREFFKVL